MNEQRDVGVRIKDLREKQLCKGNHMKHDFAGPRESKSLMYQLISSRDSAEHCCDSYLVVT